MRRKDLMPSGARWQAQAPSWLSAVLGFGAVGRSVTALMLGRILTLACCVGCSISAICRRTRCTPSHETVRKAYLATLPEDVRELERRINEGLRPPKSRRWYRRRWRVAIDLHLRPYYGKCPQKAIRGGKRKAGTKWFWTWASVSLVEHGQRWTIAVTHVGRREKLEDVLTRLLDTVERSQVLVKLALVDREFYAAEVIDVLQQRNIPFLMPVIRRGQLEGKKGPTGTRRFFQKDHFGLFEHSWTARGKSNRTRVQVKIACVPRGAHDRRETPLVFAYWGFAEKELSWYRETYRRRFGIETSYRQLGEGLAQTTTSSTIWRLMLVGASLLLRNLWVWLNQQVRHGHVTLSEQLHQLNVVLSQVLDLILELDVRPCPT